MNVDRKLYSFELVEAWFVYILSVFVITVSTECIDAMILPIVLYLVIGSNFGPPTTTQTILHYPFEDNINCN